MPVSVALGYTWKHVHIICLPKKKDGHKDDPEQGYHHAQSERPCFNSV